MATSPKPRRDFGVLLALDWNAMSTLGYLLKDRGDLREAKIWFRRAKEIAADLVGIEVAAPA